MFEFSFSGRFFSLSTHVLVHLQLEMFLCFPRNYTRRRTKRGFTCFCFSRPENANVKVCRKSTQHFAPSPLSARRRTIASESSRLLKCLVLWVAAAAGSACV